MKYLWISLGIIAALVVLVVIVGYSLPVKHRAAGEISVKATPDTLFALLTDIDRFPAWRSKLKSVERLPASEGKTRFREVAADGTISYLVESTEAPRRIVTRIDDKDLPFGGTWTYDLVPASDGRTTLRITEDGEVYNPIFRFVSRFIMGHDSTIKGVLADVSRRFPG